MNKYKLYIDETGREHKQHQSEYYILMGCIIDAAKQLELEQRANQIKYRYFKKTSVVFHSREIARNDGEFAVFNGNPAAKQEFYDDLLRMLSSAPIRVTCCVVDKAAVYGLKKPWKTVTIIEKTLDTIVLDYLNYIYAKKPSRGVIVFEASGYEKDSEYLKSFNKVLTPAWAASRPEFANVRERLTSVTFATKLNHDIESQIADLLCYGALCKYKQKHKLAKYDKTSYEHKITDILNFKLLTPSPTAKGKYLSSLVGFCEIPAKKKRTA